MAETVSENETGRQEFLVEGMTCAACALTIEKHLRSLPGVETAGVNYASHTAWVTGTATKTTLESSVRAIGYALREPASWEDSHARRLRVLRWRVILSLVCALPVAVIAMFFMHLPQGAWIQLSLTLPVMAAAGSEFILSAARKLRHGMLNMDTLVALGSGTAFIYSFINTLWPGSLGSLHGHPYIFYEAAAVVTSLVLLGRYLEERATALTTGAVRKLIALQPETAVVVRGGQEIRVNVGEIEQGETVIVLPGERIPVDGTVESGATTTDESLLTGESMPVTKERGDAVWAGTMNHNCSISMRARSTGAETKLARIARLVREAQDSKAPIQRLADRISGIFVPIVMVLAAVAGALWYFFGPEPAGVHALVATVTVLVVACPCALGLATPTAVTTGIGRGAASGILIRHAEALERVAAVRHLLLDKTGTLTEGQPSVKAEFKPGFSPETASAILSLARRSVHPVSQAIAAHLARASAGGVSFTVLTEVQDQPGKGITAKLPGGTSIYMGSPGWILREVPGSAGDWEKEAHRMKEEGLSVSVVVTGKQVVYVAGISDKIRPGVPEMTAALRKLGIEVHLVTGDHAAAATKLAEDAGIQHIQSSCSPAQKLEYLNKVRKESGGGVAFAGDGYNDAPALAAADCGIAMGTGADAALETAQVVLTGGDIRRLPGLFSLARATVRTIRRNLFWAFFYNIVSLPLAAGVLYPLFGLFPDPMIAGFAMAASSVTVVGSSLLLRRWRAEIFN